jgi:hypothetical protein
MKRTLGNAFGQTFDAQGADQRLVLAIEAEHLRALEEAACSPSG